MSYWQVCILQKEKKDPPNKLPIDCPCQDKLSLPVSTKMTPCREAMWRNNNRFESCRRSVCWLRTSESALLAGSKHCSRVGLKTTFRALIPAPWLKTLVVQLQVRLLITKSHSNSRNHKVWRVWMFAKCFDRQGKSRKGRKEQKPHREQTSIPRSKQNTTHQ